MELATFSVLRRRDLWHGNTADPQPKSKAFKIQCSMQEITDTCFVFNQVSTRLIGLWREPDDTLGIERGLPPWQGTQKKLKVAGCGMY